MSNDPLIGLYEAVSRIPQSTDVLGLLRQHLKDLDIILSDLRKDTLKNDPNMYYIIQKLEKMRSNIGSIV